MKKTRLFSLMVMLAATLCSMAQPAGFKAVSDAEKKALLSAMNDNFQTMQCDFRQEKKSVLFNEVSVSEGVMYFRKPSSLRWEYTKPTVSVVVMEGAKVKVTDADGKEQGKGGRMYRQMAALITGVVSGKELDDGKNFKSEFYVGANAYWIKLTPANRRLKVFFNHLALTLDKQKMVAVKMFMNEKEGDSTTITFSNHKVNASIDDKMFNLK